MKLKDKSTYEVFRFIQRCLKEWRNAEPPYDPLEVEMIYFILLRWEQEADGKS